MFISGPANEQYVPQIKVIERLQDIMIANNIAPFAGLFSQYHIVKQQLLNIPSLTKTVFNFRLRSRELFLKMTNPFETLTSSVNARDKIFNIVQQIHKWYLLHINVHCDYTYCFTLDYENNNHAC